ncbi:MAG TPA: tetratricopeptide repeat protein [Candidatus Kryptonia bacterium]
MSKSALIFVVGLAVTLGGCSAGKLATAPSEKTGLTQDDPVANNPKYRAAMEHFMDGSLNDAKGEFAKAILDYQDALRFYDDAAILDAMSVDYTRLGKPDNAIQTSKEAVALEPSNVSYRRTLAQAYLAGFEVDSAKIEFQKILAIDSTQVPDLVVLAQLYQRDDPRTAADLYEKALQLHGPDFPTMMQLVQLYNSTDQFEKSINVLNEMLKLDPSNLPLKEMLVDLYLQTDRNQAAVDLLQELMRTNRSDFDLKARAATAYLRMKNFKAADSLLDTVFTSDSTKADAKFAIGQFYLNEMQRDSSVAPFAQEIFGRLLKMYPKDSRSYLMSGLGASYAGHDSTAGVYLNKAVELDSTNQGAWQAIGVFYFQKSDFRRMADAMGKAVGCVPEDFRLNLFYGIALNRDGRNAEAVKPLEKAVSLNPTDMDALSTLALVYEALRRYDDAYRVYDTALKIDAKNSLILNNYAYSLSERGKDLDRALKMAQLAIQLDPNNSAFLDTIGWVYFKLGDFDKAASYVKKALTLRTAADGSPATLEEHLGDIYSSMGDKTKAVEYWQKALGHDPGNESIKQKIEKTKT